MSNIIEFPKVKNIELCECEYGECCEECCDNSDEHNYISELERRIEEYESGGRIEKYESENKLLRYGKDIMMQRIIDMSTEVESLRSMIKGVCDDST